MVRGRQRVEDVVESPWGATWQSCGRARSGIDEQDMHAGVGVKALVQASEVPRRAFLMSLRPRV